MTLSFLDFLVLDSIVNRGREHPVPAAAYTKRGKAKAYDRWLNTYPGFDSNAVVRQRLNEAAARMIYGNPAVDHYLAIVANRMPWQEPFVGYFDALDPNDLYYFEGICLRCHAPTYDHHHPEPAPAPQRPQPAPQPAGPNPAQQRAAGAAQRRAEAEEAQRRAAQRRAEAAPRRAEEAEREDREVFEQRLALSIKRDALRAAQPKALPSAE